MDAVGAPLPPDVVARKAWRMLLRAPADQPGTATMRRILEECAPLMPPPGKDMQAAVP
jgi:hypothetical protein